MQTFLPYPDFTQTACVLDYRRLGKQRVEAWQIYQTLIGISSGWKNHPIVKMWKGHENALIWYGICMCREWIERGYKDTMLDRFYEHFKHTMTLDYPKWRNDPELLSSHRSNLLRKDKDYYGQFGWTEPDNLPYKWVI